MIEKWRPAKEGDEGRIARFRYAYDGHWRTGILEKILIENDVVKVVEFCDGFDWFLHCEVLEAYLSDEEIDALGTAIQLWRHDQMRPQAPFKTVTQIIRQHFVSEEGGESL